MTDPKDMAKQFNIILGQLSMQAAICPDKVDVHVDRLRDLVIPALDAYARILAASPDVREIERTHAAVDYDQGLSGSEANEAHRNRATLLDVVRRKDAECSLWRLRYEQEKILLDGAAKEYAAERFRLKTELDETRTALATSQAETARRSVIANDHQDALVEARHRIEQLTTCPPASAADIAEAQARVADDYLAAQDGIRRYRRVICAEHRFVGQTEMGARIDVDEWESERGMLVRQNP